MNRLGRAAAVAVVGLGLLTACSEGGAAPAPMPGPDAGDGQPAGQELEPSSTRYLWQQDALADSTALDPVLAELDEPLLVRSEAEWDAWWSDVPEELQNSALQSSPPDFSDGVAVVAAVGSCPPQSLSFTTTGAGDIVAEAVTAESGMTCASDPRAVYAYGFSLESIGAASVDDVTVTLP